MSTSVMPTIAFGVVSAAVSILLVTATYQLFLHPLSRYPGPLLPKLSDIYPGFYAFRRSLHLVTYSDHVKYGPVMRHGPNKLVFNTATALKDIYRNEKVTKADSYLVSQAAPNVFNLFNSIDRDLHCIKRKLVGSAVSERATRNFEPTLSTQVDIFVRELLKSSSAPINMTERSKRLGYDIVGHLSFGYDLRLQTGDANRFLVNAIAMGNYRSNLNMQFPSSTSSISMTPARVGQDKYAQQDFYSLVSDALAAESEEMQKLYLWTEAMFFVIAGGDTSAAAISATFFYLSRNPQSYRKVAQEIRSSFKNGQEVRGGPALAGCHYLRACIDEALRMSPPVSSTPWRQLAPDEDGVLIVDGNAVPKGISVGVNIYSLHHNEEYFPEPFKFIPERWLTQSLDNDSTADSAAQKRMRDAFCPFSIGQRSCAGKPLAYLEASLTLAKTLWYFDFEAAPGALGQVGAGRTGGESGRERPQEFQLYDTFNSVHDGPYLAFKARDDSYRKELGVDR